MMRREFIEFAPNLPVNVHYHSCKHYPIHWHKAMEIIYVVEGKISVNIETETHILKEGQIEIINSDEAHSISGRSGNNKALIFNIDTGFLNKYYDIENMFFYTETSDTDVQKSEKYEKLREHLAILLCELFQRSEDFEEFIEDTLVELLYHLINNFHYLIYDEESLKDNEVQFERYDRIIKYIYSNYHNRISLQDIARREYLSSHYLSYGIKNNVGHSFNDFLNLTRVEEAIKLLLDSNKTISEISEELGFSHTRYFNKHFKKHYRCTPMQYRKKHDLSAEEYEAMKKYDTLPINTALEHIANYLEDYPRFHSENRIIKLDIDLIGNAHGDSWTTGIESVYLGCCRELYSQRKMAYIAQAKKDLNFKYGIISNVFLKKSHTFNQIAYWEEMREIFCSLMKLDIIPQIILDDEDTDIEPFMNYYKGFFGEDAMKEWSLCNFKDMERKPDLSLDPLYDTAYMIPLIIDAYINQKEDMPCPALFDELSDEEIDNSVFFGGKGLINKYGMKKPSYYAYSFLSLLGENMIDKGDGYIITQRDGNYQILLYLYDDKLKSPGIKDRALKKSGMRTMLKRKYSINLSSLPDDFRVISYNINEKNGSTYDNWISIGAPKALTGEELKLLDTASGPSVKFYNAGKSPVFNIISALEGYGANLIQLQKVQKHL